MKKRIIPVLLAVSVLLTACGASAEPIPEVTEPPAAAETPAQPAPPQVQESPAPEEKILPAPPYVDIDSWEFMYAGLDNGVSRYHPEVGTFEDQYLDIRIIEPASQFINAAREEGYQVWIGVGYRNFDYNLFYYEQAIAQYGSAYEAAKHVFPPGCSEHSTGLAFDITDEAMYAANYYDMHDETVADTPVYKWMCEHCAEYGFIVRYPEGKEDKYERACYAGHFRYVGKDAAKYITENDITFDEFLALYR